MNRQALENAIEQLDALVKSDAPEKDFQRWLEANHIVFTALNYQRVIPHPQLAANSRRLPIPDFLCQRVDGLWEILEIKRPDTLVLGNAKRRTTFYANFEKYISQCQEYSEFFDDEKSRNECSQSLGIIVQKRPAVMLIAGRSTGLDRAKIYELMSRRAPSIMHQTYDDLINTLELKRLSLHGGLERLGGFSIRAVLSIDGTDDENDLFVFDIGAQEQKNRISLQVTPRGALLLTVRDSKGIPRSLTIPSSEDTFKIGTPFYIALEIGCGLDQTALHSQ